MDFTHWSTQPIERLIQKRYVQKTNSKPAGFWFEVDGDWQRWCEGESFRLETFRFSYSLDLDLSRFLFLKTISDIDSFTSQWTKGTEYNWEVYWQLLHRAYSGIIIAPYQWERRYTDHTSWYYSWDCASGVVWNISAVRSFKLNEVRCEETQNQ